MRCTLVLEFDSEAGEPPRRVEALRLHRDSNNPIEGDIGLTLAEAKTVLLTIQQEFVGEQLNQYCCRFPFKLSLSLFHVVTESLSRSHVSRA